MALNMVSLSNMYYLLSISPELQIWRNMCKHPFRRDLGYLYRRISRQCQGPNPEWVCNLGQSHTVFDLFYIFFWKEQRIKNAEDEAIPLLSVLWWVHILDGKSRNSSPILTSFWVVTKPTHALVLVPHVSLQARVSRPFFPVSTFTNSACPAGSAQVSPLWAFPCLLSLSTDAGSSSHQDLSTWVVINVSALFSLRHY